MLNQKIILTAFCDFGMLKTSKVVGGCSAPRQSGEKGDCSLRCIHAPERCLPARAAAVLRPWILSGVFLRLKIQNRRRFTMAQKQKDEAAALDLDTSRLLSAIRCLELQCRLLLIASTFEGFQLQSADIECIGAIFIDKVSIIKTLLTEVKAC